MLSTVLVQYYIQKGKIEVPINLEEGRLPWMRMVEIVAPETYSEVQHELEGDRPGSLGRGLQRRR